MWRVTEADILHCGSGGRGSKEKFIPDRGTGERCDLVAGIVGVVVEEAVVAGVTVNTVAPAASVLCSFGPLGAGVRVVGSLITLVASSLSGGSGGGRLVVVGGSSGYHDQRCRIGGIVVGESYRKNVLNIRRCPQRVGHLCETERRRQFVRRQRWREGRMVSRNGSGEVAPGRNPLKKMKNDEAAER